MPYERKPLSCNPSALNGLSEKLIVSHCENNYGGAVKRLNAIEQKLAEYREAGIPLIWVVYPATRTAHVLGANRQRRELGQDGVLDGEGILPGLSIPLADIFPVGEEQA